MEQRIGFCTSADGVRIAYAVAGHGFPLVRAATWITHVEHDADHLVWRHWWRELSRDHTFVRYDQRGCGLSDRHVSDYSLDARLRDLESVVDTLGLRTFDLFGHSHGAPTAIAYAARHPDRVNRLVLFNGCAGGPYVGWRPTEVMDALWQLMETSWDEPRTRRMFATWNIPDAPPRVIEAAAELLRLTASPETAVPLLSTANAFDVTESLGRIRAPTLVLQSTSDEVIPAEQSRTLASLIPNVRSVDITTRNHILLEDEPAWRVFTSELRAFCATPVAALVAQEAPDDMHGLSARELQVLKLIGEGKTDREIAEALVVSARTVSNHVKSILQKSETANRAHAVAWAARRGLL